MKRRSICVVIPSGFAGTLVDTGLVPHNLISHINRTIWAWGKFVPWALLFP